MANPTSNFGWQMPTPTDLVTDLPADFEVFGQAVDTSLADLKGGTSGQVLSKNSNTDMDFVWVTSDDANAIQNAIVDAKGDLIAASAADTPARLAVGANDLVLTADSTQATGLAYTGGWTTWTPTYTNITIGDGTVIARYQKIGKTVNLFWDFVLGSTSAIGTNPSFTLPINAAQQNVIFNARLLDAGVTVYFGIGRLLTAAISLQEMRVNATYGDIIGGFTATVPFTWTTNDKITLQASYEVA